MRVGTQLYARLATLTFNLGIVIFGWSASPYSMYRDRWCVSGRGQRLFRRRLAQAEGSRLAGRPLRASHAQSHPLIATRSNADIFPVFPRLFARPTLLQTWHNWISYPDSAMLSDSCKLIRTNRNKDIPISCSHTIPNIQDFIEPYSLLARVSFKKKLAAIQHANIMRIGCIYLIVIGWMTRIAERKFPSQL